MSTKELVETVRRARQGHDMAEERTAEVERRHAVLVAERDARTDSALARLATAERERDEARAELGRVRGAIQVACEDFGSAPDGHREPLAPWVVQIAKERDEARAERAAADGNAQRLLPRLNAAEASRDAALAALARVVKVASKSCSVCGGTGLREKPCTFCGDSTYDHMCNDEMVPCATCAPLRAALAATTDPAALGAKVIEQAEERGAGWGMAAPSCETCCGDGTTMAASTTAPRAFVFAPAKCRDCGGTGKAGTPATVCRAARGGG